MGLGKEKSEENLKTIIWRYLLNSLDETFFNIELLKTKFTFNPQGLAQC